MSLREKYLKILSGMVSAGAVGATLLLGSTAPVAAEQDPIGAQPKAAGEARVSERLAAIRAAMSDVAGSRVDQGDQQLAWAAWRNGGGGWRNGGGAWRNGGGGWRNGGAAWHNGGAAWRNGGGGGWHNGGWNNFWRNW